LPCCRTGGTLGRIGAILEAAAAPDRRIGLEASAGSGRVRSAAMITAFLIIVCEPRAIGQLGRALAETDGVVEVYTTTGGADFIAVVRVADLDELATVVTQRIAALPGIVRTDTHLAIRSYGRGEERAAFDIGVD
jgi:DNA-binding Lrp family transcriptional regulator